ncbi:MAG: phosphatase PAP2 family protein [Oscillospiraceae bacterium]|jgi:undecaprenyl-diphosphatase|nr:phosphatase PAP2 family protein [Oscillospiraceae bacterium]
MGTWIVNTDWSLLHLIRSTLSCRWLDTVMLAASWLGNFGMLWILAGLLLLCTKKYRVQGLLLLLSLAAGALLGNAVLKPLVARPRPCWLDPGTVLLLPMPRGYSFPSGHALTAAAAAAVLTLTNRKFAWAAVPAALLIGFSRLYLYVHFPSDVLCGLLLGAAVGTAVFCCGEKYLRLPRKTSAIKKE